MDEVKILEEKLRECASIGDKDGIEECLCQGTDINSQNGVNGWTALHWSCRRGYPTITRFLLSKGADPRVTTNKGELAIQLTDNMEIKQMLSRITGDTVMTEDSDEKSASKAESEVKAALPSFTPNYLKHPPFPYGKSSVHTTTTPKQNGLNSHRTCPDDEDELVLKVRVAESAEKDFIEIELPCDALTFENLMAVCCEELVVVPSEVVKIRKRPNTIVRKDKDVRRLQDFQELELITKKKPPFGTTDYSVPFQNLLY